MLCITQSQMMPGSVPTLHTFSLSTCMHVIHIPVVPVVGYRCRQQLLYCIINEFGILLITPIASKPTPDYPQLCIWHLAKFIICSWEVQVSLSWHHQRLCLDACQCLYMISIKSWRGTNMSILQNHTHIKILQSLVARPLNCSMKRPASAAHDRQVQCQTMDAHETWQFEDNTTCSKHETKSPAMSRAWPADC